MGADGIDFSVIQDNNFIRILYGTDSLRNNNFRGLRKILLECLLDQRICAGIHGTGGVVQNQHPGFLKQCPGNTETLLLTAGNIGAALLNVGFVTFRQGIDKFIRAGKTAGFFYFLIGGFFVAPAQVFRNGAGKQFIFLKHHGNGVAQSIQVIFPNVHTAQRQAAGGNVVESRNELHQGRLGGTGTADDAQGFAGSNVQVNVA